MLCHRNNVPGDMGVIDYNLQRAKYSQRITLILLLHSQTLQKLHATLYSLAYFCLQDGMQLRLQFNIG